jgi:modulator of FtsH protease HflK
MAWNDPGRNRSPWGNRPDRGAADLDEALRNLQRRLSGLFGGGGDGGAGGEAGGPGGGAMRGFGAGTVVLALLAIWAATGLYKVDAAERAVVTRFGQYVATMEPGLRWHMPWPIETRQIINVESVEGFSDQTRMLTSDENLVDINIAVQYRRAEARAFAFNVRDPESTLGEVSESAIREIVGRSRLDFVLEEGRQEIAALTKELIQRTLDSYQSGIEVTSVNLQGVGVPEQVSSAQAYANDILPKARGSASRQLEDAQAYRARIVADAEGEAARFLKLLQAYERAPGVTRQRLYFETIEEVLGNTNKVLVDTQNSGNMLYLPLDKLTDRRLQTLTLDEQRQSPGARAAPEQPDLTETVDARRDRGTR